MPNNVIEFRAVVASPADAFDARKAVFDAIQELNRAFDVQNITIKGLGWEEYATPGIGLDAQEVINGQILREYDILVAVFSTTLGTPTANALSGTVEEIDNAISKVESAMGMHRVQVYFLDRIESASQISIEELAKVFSYREKIGKAGILYRTFKERNELQKEVRVNIQRPILDYLQTQQHIQMRPRSDLVPECGLESQVSLQNSEVNSTGEESGLLDHMEKSEDAIAVVNVSLNRIAEMIVHIGEETSQQVARMEAISAPSIPAKEKKIVVNNFASLLKSRAHDLKREAAKAREWFAIWTSSVITAARIEREDGDIERYKRDRSAFFVEIKKMRISALEARIPIAGYRASVEALPRITIQFNQAKKLLIDALDECMQLLDQTEHGLNEITGTI